MITGPQSTEATVLDDGSALLKITESGQYTVTGSGTAWIVVVGGGGGGGIFAGGGGGGGAVVEEKEYSLTAGTYDIVIGKGGSGATTNEEITALCPATSGGDSSAFGITALGGGAGGGYNTLNADGTAKTYVNKGSDGGSGGGSEGGNKTTFGKGSVTLADSTTNDGAVGSGNISNCLAGGGGGGAGGAGYAYMASTDATETLYPTGGVGVATQITGTETWFGGGGAGGMSYDYNKAATGGLGGGGAGGGMNGGNNKATPGSDAEANTGGGGGGAGRFFHHNSLTSGNLADGYRAGNGADGIVIIRFTPNWKDGVEKQQGGEIKKSGLYYVHTFAEDSNFTVTDPVIVDALVVAGGGAGGWRGETGGGGAGGVIIKESLHLLPGTYTVTVGAGGIASTTNDDAGRDGSDSSFAGLVAKGGGAGSNCFTAGHDGGSGGGGGGHGNSGAGYRYVGGSGVEGQGHAGGANKPENAEGVVGTRGGGGGGAGGAGSLGIIVNENGTTTRCGDGGIGIACDFSGEEKWYGGGGGGGAHNQATTQYGAGQGGKGGGGSGSGYNGGNNFAWDGENGEAGTGGGGGGGGLLGNGKGETDTLHGGNGGSGIVIIRYKRALPGFSIIVR